MPDIFTAGDVMSLIGTPRRLLNYMLESGMVKSSIREPDGPGTRRLFSFRDLLEIRIACLFPGENEVVRQVLGIIRGLPDLDRLNDRDAIIWDGKSKPTHVNWTREQEIEAKERGEAQIVIGLGLIARFLREDIKADRRRPANLPEPEWAAPAAAGKEHE